MLKTTNLKKLRKFEKMYENTNEVTLVYLQR